MLWFLDRGVGFVVAHSDDNSANVVEKLLPDLIPPTPKEREEVGKLEGQVVEELSSRYFALLASEIKCVSMK
ncbi:hypothetical protein [Cryobacterium sp. M23]|uniref:hypothetical protein n=1 Tax=Cryobacterium sp. M23 TaxID=2048292 RepID=UPI000CE2BB6A|nr:hypothetical protein [Cryobacterium sp. M23]